MIARFYSPADYGLFNLYYTILSIFASIGAIGLRNGIQRNIAYHLGKDEKDRVPAIIGWGLAIALAGGIVFGFTLFMFSKPIASLFSDDPILGYYLKIAAIAVPFFIITMALESTFRGFQRTKERIIFNVLGRNTLILISIIIVGLLSLRFVNLITAVSISLIFLSAAFLTYYLKNKRRILGIKKAFKWDLSLGKKLLLFSLPLLLVGLSYRVIGWTDTMMIGYFMSEDFVGYYQAAKPLSHFINTGLSVATFIYAPLAASLYGQKKNRESKIIFSSITKWVCFGTLPIALIFIYYSSWVIDFFFGPEYSAAAFPLQILAAMYFVILFMGPNASTLTAFGKTKFLMYVSGATALLNVILNGVLIPFYGIVGAAVATAFSNLSLNVIRTKKLKDLSGIHSLQAENIKPIIFSIILSLPIVIVLRSFLPISIILVGVSAVSFYLISFLSIILTKSLSRDDIKLLLLIENKLGIELTFIKKLLKKFL